MTLTQLKYILAIAQTSSISTAAKLMFVSQPNMSNAIRELEEELGSTLFTRASRGVVPTIDGDGFLGYARQVIEQTSLIEEKYQGRARAKKWFYVSTQHYSFAVKAFVDLIRKHDWNEYDFRIRETQTYDVIEDVVQMRGEGGVLYLNSYNETAIRKVITDNNLVFHSLFTVEPHGFLGASNPLSTQSSVTLEDLTGLPRLSYEQGEHNAFYYSEEPLSTLESAQDIRVRNRATLFNLLVGLNGYTICMGLINKELNGPTS